MNGRTNVRTVCCLSYHLWDVFLVFTLLSDRISGNIWAVFGSAQIILPAKFMYGFSYVCAVCPSRIASRLTHTWTRKLAKRLCLVCSLGSRQKRARARLKWAMRVLPSRIILIICRWNDIIMCIEECYSELSADKSIESARLTRIHVHPSPYTRTQTARLLSFPHIVIAGKTVVINKRTTHINKCIRMCECCSISRNAKSQ